MIRLAMRSLSDEMTMKLTQKRLKKLLHYNQKTGAFTWLMRPNRHIRIGDIAGTLSNGHVQIGICGAHYKASRLAWFYMTGKWPQFEIDHKDTVPSNNRWKNLRPLTHAINMQNQRKAHSNNRTGFLGVSEDTRPGRKGFYARIQIDQKQHRLGTCTHPTPKLAYAEYLKAKRKLHQGCTL